MTTIHRNLSRSHLIALALKNKEGVLASNGALNVTTGKRTGRSPKDRFIVKDLVTENTVAWGQINQPIAPETFDALWLKIRIALNRKANKKARRSTKNKTEKSFPFPIKHKQPKCAMQRAEHKLS